MRSLKLIIAARHSLHLVGSADAALELLPWRVEVKLAVLLWSRA